MWKACRQRIRRIILSEGTVSLADVCTIFCVTDIRDHHRTLPEFEVDLSLPGLGGRPYAASYGRNKTD